MNQRRLNYFVIQWIHLSNDLSFFTLQESVNHEFIVKMDYAFQTESKLYFCLEYCPGGELFFYLSQIGRFKQDAAKFYAANIVLAL